MNLQELKEKTSTKSPQPNCCCIWGLGVVGEWPEFECMDCPVHLGEGLMGDDRLCRRHWKAR